MVSDPAAGPCFDSWSSGHPNECHTSVCRSPGPSRSFRQGFLLRHGLYCAACDSEAQGWIRAPASGPGCHPCGSRCQSWATSPRSCLCSVLAGSHGPCCGNPAPGSLYGSFRGCGHALCRGGSPGRRFPEGNQSLHHFEHCGCPRDNSWICCNHGYPCLGMAGAWGQPPCEASLQSVGSDEYN